MKSQLSSGGSGEKKEGRTSGAVSSLTLGDEVSVVAERLGEQSASEVDITLGRAKSGHQEQLIPVDISTPPKAALDSR